MIYINYKVRLKEHVAMSDPDKRETAIVEKAFIDSGIVKLKTPLEGMVYWDMHSLEVIKDEVQ